MPPDTGGITIYRQHLTIKASEKLVRRSRLINALEEGILHLNTYKIQFIDFICI
ncbi:hypothetical protein LWM68_01840 [Niabella sp. W65]|nr:hypothetical protein [Niabella sp. W65]MCH7361637.1 hypothetical protein [Niabella sp. W65]ULT45416.1 hypothetical protein KRR40_20355 [Niabella sp. I65]